MFKRILKSFQSLTKSFGFNIVRYKKKDSVIIYPSDFTSKNVEICNAVKKYTMTSPERVTALIDAINYVVANKISGAFVECGVWKGGSSMAMALSLKNWGDESRDLYLYDTFTGMSAPTEADIAITGDTAQQVLSDDPRSRAIASLDEVKKNIFSTGYPKDKIHFIKGKVETTIPASVPKEIALLRLDTDWYESTKHEMNHLFPLLKRNGVLIIDDYGHWDGARRAIDEYISDNNVIILLSRIDYTGRIAVKL